MKLDPNRDYLQEMIEAQFELDPGFKEFWEADERRWDQEHADTHSTTTESGEQ